MLLYMNLLFFLYLLDVSALIKQFTCEFPGRTLNIYECISLTLSFSLSLFPSLFRSRYWAGTSALNRYTIEIEMSFLCVCVFFVELSFWLELINRSYQFVLKLSALSGVL